MEEYGAVLQNQPVDVGEEFARQVNHFFIGSKVSEFDPRTAFGRIPWKGLALKQGVCGGARQGRRGDTAHATRTEYGANGLGEIELAVYSTESTTAEGLFCLPENGALHSLGLRHGKNGFVLTDDPLESKVEWNVRTSATKSRRDG
jgi:hypothetical protein